MQEEYREYDKLIYHIIHKRGLTAKLDDYYDIGLIGLVTGLNTYNETKNTKKSTYMYVCIDNAIKRQLIKDGAVKRNGNIVPIECDTLENMADDTNLEQDTLMQEQKKDLYSKLFQLPIYEQYIIYQSFFKNRTKKEIASRLGFSRSKVNKLQKKGLERLRKLYGLI